MEYGGQYETPCSRISHVGAFSGCRIGPTGHPGVPPLRLRTFWLRLRTFWLRLPSSLLPSSLLRLPSSLPSLLKGTLGPPQRAAIALRSISSFGRNPPHLIVAPTSDGGSIAPVVLRY